MNEVATEVSLWGMFWSAHIVVKIVMLGLLGSSVWCWSVIVNKIILFRQLQRSMDRFEADFWSGNSLEELYQALSPQQTQGMSTLFVAAMREWKRSFSAGAASAFMGLQARIEKVLDVSIGREVERLESQLLVLASVASAGPFVGLFGTVWGIMTSFRSIAASKNTSLAVAVDDKGAIFVMDEPVETDQLLDKLRGLAKAGFDERIYVRGAKAVNYGRIAEIMSLITAAGYKKVALVTEQEPKK